jgi:hypothetical protein
MHSPATEKIYLFINATGVMFMEAGNSSLVVARKENLKSQRLDLS